MLIKDDYIKILGRTTDLINVGGEKVYPIEVESTLLEMNEINDARVYCKDHPLTGKMILADLLVDECYRNRDFIKKVRAFCATKLERFKIPSKFVFVEKELAGERFKKKR